MSENIRERRYDISFEIAGPMAMFNRPDSGSTPVSYPVPTWSALKGMFEAVARIPYAYVRPTRVEICRPVRFNQYTTNYGGPLRKPSQVTGDNNYQLRAIVLVDVCYKVFGSVELTDDAPGGINPAHALADVLMRRIERGQCLYTPCLGWKEFAPDYFGPLRTDTNRDESVLLVVPALLHSVFDRPRQGRVAATYRQNVPVIRGSLNFEDAAYAE